METAGKMDEDAGTGVDQYPCLFPLPCWRKEILTGLWTDSVVVLSVGFVYSVPPSDHVSDDVFELSVQEVQLLSSRGLS